MLTRPLRSAVPLVLALTACADPAVEPGTDAASPDPDAASPVPEPDPDAAPPAPNVQITVKDAASVTCRDGRGAWAPAVSLGDDRYTFHATEDYQCFIGCEQPGTTSLLLAATVADEPSPVACRWVPPPDVPLYVLTTTMQQSGTVLFGRTSPTSAFSAWDVTLRAPAGVHDLVAYDHERMAIRRAIEVTGDGTLPGIDLAVEGAALEEISVEVTNLAPQELTGAYSTITVGDRTFELDGHWDVAKVPPAGLLTEAELARREVGVRVDTVYTQRTASAVATGDTASFTLMPFPEGATFSSSDGAWVTSWATLPEVDVAQLSVSTSANDEFRRVVATVTGRWLAATGATGFGYDDLPPDVDPAYLPLVGGTTYMNLQLRHDDGTTRRTVFVMPPL